MMYLDYSIWKFPIFSLGDGGKRRGKLSHWLYKLKFLPFIPSRLRGRGGRASDFQSVDCRFDPWRRTKIFFSLFFIWFLFPFLFWKKFQEQEVLFSQHFINFIKVYLFTRFVFIHFVCTFYTNILGKKIDLEIPSGLAQGEICKILSRNLVAKLALDL